MKRLSVFLLVSLILAVGSAAYAGKPPPPIPVLTGNWYDLAAPHLNITTSGPGYNSVKIDLVVVWQEGTQFVGTLKIFPPDNPNGFPTYHNIAGDINPTTKEVNFQAGHNDRSVTPPAYKFAIINGKGTLGADQISGNFRRLFFAFDLENYLADAEDFSFNLKKELPVTP